MPAGTQTGKKFRFKEMGAPDVKHRGRTGALLVEIKVQVPTNLSDDERDAMPVSSAATLIMYSGLFLLSSAMLPDPFPSRYRPS